jgi:hypothetical protein
MTAPYGTWKARRIMRLWKEQHGLCYWCKRLTFAPDDPQRFSTKPNKVKRLGATIDHLYSRLNPLRHTKAQRWVMACSACNKKRAEQECAGEFKEEHVRRSRAGLAT